MQKQAKRVVKLLVVTISFTISLHAKVFAARRTTTKTTTDDDDDDGDDSDLANCVHSVAIFGSSTVVSP